MDSEATWGFHVKDGLLSVICGDGNCRRRATVRLGIDTLIANILVSTFIVRPGCPMNSNEASFPGEANPVS